MQKPYAIHAKVNWKWLGGVIEGRVKEVYLEKVTRLIKGKSITRNGSPEKPAYLVESLAGNLALKLHTELFLPSPSPRRAIEDRPRPVKKTTYQKRIKSR